MLYFRIIGFVNEKELEAKVPKGAWTKDLGGSHEYKYENNQLQLPEDFPEKKFGKELSL